MGLVFALIVAAIALVVISVVVKGLGYLLIIGLVVLVLALVSGAVRARRANPRMRR
jgi:hypothetical protein